MSILFGILIFLNLSNPENIDFAKQAIYNDKNYECKFVYKGLSQPTNKYAWKIYGYTLFKQECKK